MSVCDHDINPDSSPAIRRYESRNEEANGTRDFMAVLLKPLCPGICWEVGQPYEEDDRWFCDINGIPVCVDDGTRAAIKELRRVCLAVVNDLGDVIDALK